MKVWLRVTAALCLALAAPAWADVHADALRLARGMLAAQIAHAADQHDIVSMGLNPDKAKMMIDCMGLNQDATTEQIYAKAFEKVASPAEIKLAADFFSTSAGSRLAHMRVYLLHEALQQPNAGAKPPVTEADQRLGAKFLETSAGLKLGYHAWNAPEIRQVIDTESEKLGERCGQAMLATPLTQQEAAQTPAEALPASGEERRTADIDTLRLARAMHAGELARIGLESRAHKDVLLGLRTMQEDDCLKALPEDSYNKAFVGVLEHMASAAEIRLALNFYEGAVGARLVESAAYDVREREKLPNGPKPAAANTNDGVEVLAFMKTSAGRKLNLQRLGQAPELVSLFTQKMLPELRACVPQGAGPTLQPLSQEPMADTLAAGTPERTAADANTLRLVRITHVAESFRYGLNETLQQRVARGDLAAETAGCVAKESDDVYEAAYAAAIEHTLPAADIQQAKDFYESPAGVRIVGQSLYDQHDKWHVANSGPKPVATVDDYTAYGRFATTSAGQRLDLGVTSAQMKQALHQNIDPAFQQCSLRLPDLPVTKLEMKPADAPAPEH